jgi:hypothetical protein
LKECLRLMRVFAPSSSEFIPFLNCHHSITDFEINAFPNQDSYRLLKFVSDLVSVFDTGCFGFTSQSPSARDSGCRPSFVTLNHYFIIFLKVISKVLFFNITQNKFISAAVDLFV